MDDIKKINEYCISTCRYYPACKGKQLKKLKKDKIFYGLTIAKKGQLVCTFPK